ncbi:vacuolar fusion protein ccz1 [Thoreauomyces humboldtii]|nr:vacuolar fusion protein ccz1 [Thoreauomyces humboldtii]
MNSDSWKHRPPCLVYFAVFNPSFNTSEDGAADQICFFHPSTISKDEKARQVGLAQALVNFTKTREGQKQVEFLEEEMKDSILKSVLSRTWDTFKLFHKGVAHLKAGNSMEVVRKVLDHFFTSYLPRLDFPSLDLLDAFDGIQFASLPKTSYLQVSSFIRELTAAFPSLQHPVLLWHDHLVWNGLETFDVLKPLYNYITDPETGRVYDGIVNQVKRKGEPIISTRRVSLKSARQGRGPSALIKSVRRLQKFTGFLVGPAHLGSVNVDLKTVYIGEDGNPHHLIVYQLEEECTLVLPIPLSSSNVEDVCTAEFYARLSPFLDERLKVLMPIFAEGWASARSLGEFADQHFRYFYYNSMNLAFKTSIGSYKSTILTPDLVQSLSAMHEDLARVTDVANELCVKTTTSESWIIGRRSGSRELYLVFPKSEMGLVDVDDEVKTFTMAYFSDVLQ